MQPTDWGRSSGPGTANTARPCSIAQSAVMRAPLRAPASTTTVASASPAMILLRRGKPAGSGRASGGSSAITAPPVRTISRASVSCTAGYRCAWPLPRTATVIPLHSRAPAWADPSMPTASPETTVPPPPPARHRCAPPSAAPRSSAAGVPTTATTLVASSAAGSPATNRTGGVRSISRSRRGYPGSSAVSASIPSSLDSREQRPAGGSGGADPAREARVPVVEALGGDRARKLRRPAGPSPAASTRRAPPNARTSAPKVTGPIPSTAARTIHASRSGAGPEADAAVRPDRPVGRIVLAATPECHPRRPQVTSSPRPRDPPVRSLARSGRSPRGAGPCLAGRAIAGGLLEMLHRDPVRVGQIGNRARNAHEAFRGAAVSPAASASAMARVSARASSAAAARTPALGGGRSAWPAPGADAPGTLRHGTGRHLTLQGRPDPGAHPERRGAPPPTGRSGPAAGRRSGPDTVPGSRSGRCSVPMDPRPSRTGTGSSPPRAGSGPERRLLVPPGPRRSAPPRAAAGVPPARCGRTRGAHRGTASPGAPAWPHPAPGAARRQPAPRTRPCGAAPGTAVASRVPGPGRTPPPTR